MSQTKELLRRGVGDFEPTPDAFDRVLARRDRRHRNQRVAAGVLGIAVFALAAVGLVRLLGSGSTPAIDPDSPFAGTWISTSDPDGGTQTMTVEVFADGDVEIVVTDDVATVCSGTSSTMTGTGRLEGPTTFVIPAPHYTCDDGSEPQALSGPPLAEQLRDLAFAIDAETETLTDGFDGIWVREGAGVPSPQPTVSGGMWPQTSLEEIHQAQELADAGDPDYTWQVDPALASFGGPDAAGEPLESEIFERFIREEIGWDEFSGYAIGGYVPGGGHLEGVVFIRCAPGRTNPLYPDAYPEMPREVRRCAPTIGDSLWETVRFNVEQQARFGPSGIWVVSAWEMLQPGEPHATVDGLDPSDGLQLEQVAPPSNAEVTALLQAFLGARVDGVGAEEYLHRHEDGGWGEEEVPLLYATNGGSPYERTEIERVLGPVWPTGWIELKVRLFAGDGTVVEQSLVVVRQEDGRLGLVYGSPTSPIPTTENGQAVPVQYRILDGEVTFAAAPPWRETSLDRSGALLGGVGRGSASQLTMFQIMADPLTTTDCGAGSVPADAEALAQSIRSNADLEATVPVAVSVGGIDALQMDVASRQPEVGDCGRLLGLPSWEEGYAPTRLYLLDLPEGMSARILAIAISAEESQFEYVAEAARPVLDSFEFQAP